MKKFLSSISVIFTVAGIFISCEIETSDNGKLDGYWKLCSVDTLSTGKQTDLTEKSIFWAVQANLLSAQDNNSAESTIYMFRFQYESDSLKVYNPQIYNKQEGNKEVTDIESLRIFGINSLTNTFYIEKLSGKYMKLSDKNFRLHFRKY